MDVKVIKQDSGKDWSMYQGDCIDVLRGLPDESVHYSIFSPPFVNLYTYSDSERDIGNNKTRDSFEIHFGFVVKELYRVIKQGRLCSVHCANIPIMKEREGYIGVRDFRGDIIRLFQSVGWIYHAEVCIWKDPLIEATRTKALGLMYKQLVKDSAMARMGMPDYIVTMRKPGENLEPITHPEGSTQSFIGEENVAPKGFGIGYSHDVWRKYASPVWMDIRQGRTLNKEGVREEKDERHICPLQLDVIERCLELWSNRGDIVLSPFAGIGSEGYVSLQKGRKFIGMELKESYYKQAILNLRKVDR